MILVIIAILVVIYIVGWLITVFMFSASQKQFPTGKEMTEICLYATLWPMWWLLFAVTWIMELFK